MTYRVTLTKEQLFEMLCDYYMTHEEGLEIVELLDMDVIGDLAFTEMCAKYFINEMANHKDSERWESFVQFMKGYIK